MKTLRWFSRMAGMLALTLAAGAYAQEYTLHARVSYDAGGTMIKGKDDADWSQAPTNTLVLPGDVLWVDRGGNMELELSGGSFVRLADGSKAELVSLPPSGRIKGWAGSFYVNRSERSTDQMMLETPACQVSVATDSEVRVDVLDQGATTVSVRFGQAVIVGADGTQTVANAGERCWADPGMLPSEVAPYNRESEDDFDVWNRQRVDVLLSGMRSLPKTIPVTANTLGYADLASCGEWVEVDSHSYWRPTVSVDFIPYRHGHWSFVMGVGHVWVEDYPFGYITSHYGRWGYFPSRGWMWSYDPVWSPAWVATVRCGDYYVWTPVDYDCRPVVVTQSAFFSVGGVSFGISASSFVPVSHIYDGPHYIDYCTPTVVSYVEHHHTEVNIWNINMGAQNHMRVPYERGFSDRVRNYNPRRSIRGPVSMERSLPAASTRVARLETGMGRATFARETTQTSAPSVRTRLSDSDRASRTRTVSLQHAPSLSPAARSAAPRERATDSTPAREASPGREAAPATREGRINTPRGGNDSSTPSRLPAVRDSAPRTERGGAPASSGNDRTTPTRPNAGRDATPRTERGETPASSGNDRTTPTRPNVGRDSTPRTERGETPASSGNDRTTPTRPNAGRDSTPRTQRGDTPASSGNDRTTPSRLPAVRDSAPQRERTNTPDADHTSRPEERGGRTPMATVDMDQTPSGGGGGRTGSVRPGARTSVPDRSMTPSTPSPRTESRPSRSSESTGSTMRERSPQRDMTPTVRPSQRMEPSPEPRQMTRPTQSVESRPSLRPAPSAEPRATRAAPERSSRPALERPASPAPRMEPSVRQESPRPVTIQPAERAPRMEMPRPSTRVETGDPSSRRPGRATSDRSNGSGR